MAQLSYRPDIDGLRAIAVLSVVVYHAVPWILPGGFIGVDIFFVISGYLITGLIIDALAEGRFSILDFYGRRIRRIFPAAILVLTAVALVGWAVLFPGEFRTLGQHIVASAAFFENFRLWSEAGYFDVASETKPLLHLWSLAVEEQFYLVWPLLLMAIGRAGRRFLPVLGLLGIASFGLSIYLAAHDPVAAFYSPFARFWELMAGAALAFLQHRNGRLLTRMSTPSAFAGLTMIAVGLALIDEAAPFPGWPVLLPVTGTVLMIAAGPAAWPNARILALRPMVYVGLISYPLYLWHWPLLSYARIVTETLPETAALGLVAASAGLAALTYHLIERPIRSSARRASSIRATALLAVMIVLAGVGLALQRPLVTPRLESVPLREGDEWRFLFQQLDAIDPTALGVYRSFDSRERLTLFVGDSQIAQYAERIAATQERRADANGAIYYLAGACPPIPDAVTHDIVRQGCWPHRQAAYRAARDPRVSTVVIGASWAYYLLWSDFFIDEAGDEVPLNTPEGRALALESLAAAIGALKAGGKEVFLLIGNPGLDRLRPTVPADRLRRHGRSREITDRVAITQEQIDVRQDMLDLATRTGAIPIDPVPAFCESNRCRWAEPDGMSVYSDSSHFNPAWALNNAGFIDAAVLPKKP